MSSPVSAVLCSPWATVADVPADLRAELSIMDDAELQTFLDKASEILWALSGRRWYGGGCTETAKLRSVAPMPGMGTWPYHRSWLVCGCWNWGTWSNGWLYPAGLAYAGSHVGQPMAIRLPRSPVTAVTAVTINGDPFTDYELRRSGWLERTDGNGWQVCGDTTEITYTYGEPPPTGGRDSAVELGTELAKDRLNLDSCALPPRTTNVTRQGVTATVVDPAEFLDKGKTGLPGVDLWLAAVNPEARPQAGTVWSPDIPTSIGT